MGLAVKPYPSCRYSHAAMDALRHLRAANDVDVDAISAVEIGLPQTGQNIIGTPLAQKHAPKTVVDGQFSMPFLAAVILRKGDLGWDDYDQLLSDPETLALTRKVSCVVDPAAEAEFPANMAGVARVTVGGERLETMVVVPKGEPDNFLTEAELTGKFERFDGPISQAPRAAPGWPTRCLTWTRNRQFRRSWN